MTTVSHNSTTPSVSVTTASGNNQPQLVASLVPDEQRISFWPQHFGLIPQWVTLEPRIFGWMDRLCEDYCGGIWNLYTLNNGGAFMAPEPDDDDDETWVLFNAMNGNWYENVYEDFREVCDIFGVNLRQRVFRLSNGRFMEEPCIWFSGFCSQGDGACFEGRWHWQPATVRRIRKYAPQEHELHRIADALQAVQKRNFWQLQAEISHRGRYCHPYSMDITVTRNSPTGQAMTADAEAAVSEVLRDLAFWLYRQLENEYDWLTSDAAVDEALLINEYTFTEAGLRAG